MKRIKLTIVLLLALSVAACSADADKNYRVRAVLDGDTIELSNGARVRYLGIDTPETRVNISGDWVFKPEPFAVQAMQMNESLVENKKVTLEFDIKKKDKYGRLLAYVYVDGVMVNEELIKSGFASVYIFPPNVKHQDEMVDLQKEAIFSGRGIWANLDNISPYEALNHIGRYVRATGVVVAVNYVQDRVYINFDRNYREVLSAVIYKGNLLTFEKAGMNPAFLKGREITIVGKVRDQNGPRIVLDNPSQLTVQ